jgi:hypothetical protein
MSLTRPNVIGNPFAYNGDYILPPTDGSNTDAIVSQEVGYPETQSAPLGSGGIPVNRQQTNGIYNLYTNTIVWLNAGGTFTFDNTIVTTQGGYSKGAVLWCESINGYLVSLIDNNAADFVTNPDYINDNVNWQTVNNITSDFNRNNNLGTVTTHTISLADVFSLIYNDGISIAYTLPNYPALPVGATFCIKNQTGTISNGVTTITMTSAYSNAYYKCEIGNNGWIIDGQPIATYSQWATQAYVATQKYYSLLITSTSTWTCPANLTQIYVTLIGGGGGGGGLVLYGNAGNSTSAFGQTSRGGAAGANGSAGGVGGSLVGSAGANGNLASGGFIGLGGGGGTTWIASAGGTDRTDGISGGGGNGAYANVGSNTCGGGGGASGELIFKRLVTVIPGTTYTVTIGNGGAAVSGSGSGGDGAVLIEY